MPERITPQLVRDILRKAELRATLIDETSGKLRILPEFGWTLERGWLDSNGNAHRIAAALSAAGLAAKIKDGMVWVPVLRPIDDPKEEFP